MRGCHNRILLSDNIICFLLSVTHHLIKGGTLSFTLHPVFNHQASVSVSPVSPSPHHCFPHHHFLNCSRVYIACIVGDLNRIFLGGHLCLLGNCISKELYSMDSSRSAEEEFECWGFVRRSSTFSECYLLIMDKNQLQ